MIDPKVVFVACLFLILMYWEGEMNPACIVYSLRENNRIMQCEEVYSLNVRNRHWKIVILDKCGVHWFS